MGELRSKIKDNLITIYPVLVLATPASVLDFCIDEVIDRVQLYLNVENVPIKLSRILAQITYRAVVMANENDKNITSEPLVSSISDNGQSITYSHEIKTYFTTIADNDLFTGFESLLKRYRRINVVHSKYNER